MAKSKKVSRINPPSPMPPTPPDAVGRRAAPQYGRMAMPKARVERALGVTPSIVPPMKKQPKPGRFK